jgi:hypothetical protein
MKFKVLGVSMKNWVYSARDGYYWRAFMTAALNPGVS